MLENLFDVKKPKHIQNSFFSFTFYNCNGTIKKDNPEIVIEKASGENKKLSDNDNNYLAIDLDYEKYPREKLKPIVEILSTTNLTKEWTFIKKINLNSSTENGEATFYFDNDELKKITTEIYSKTEKNAKEYYLHKNKIIFAYENKSNLNNSISFDTAKMRELNDSAEFEIENIEERNYFINATLVHQSNNQDCGSPFSPAYLMAEQERIKHQLKILTDLVKK